MPLRFFLRDPNTCIMARRNIIIWFLLLSAGPGTLFAQATFKFNHLGPEEGLSHPSVTCIIKDSYGFMWFGTRDGLNRYNSYEFKTYKSSTEDPNSLSDNTISCLYEDHSGMLWIGTEGGGLNSYDPVQDQFQHYMHDPDVPNSLPHNAVSSITEDMEGELWVATMGGGLCRFNRETGSFTTFAHDPGDPNSLGSDMVMSVMQDEDGIFWLATEGAGLGRFDPVLSSFRHYRHDPHDPFSIGTDLLRSVIEDREGRIWLGSWGYGIQIFDKGTERFTRIQADQDDSHGLPSNNVFAICEDPHGGIWIGTRSGLSLYEPRKGSFTNLVSVSGDPNSLADNVAFSLYYSRNDEILWVGTWGNGINLLDRYGRQILHFVNNPDDPNSLNDNDVFSLFEDRDGILWIGTEGGGLNRYDPSTGAFRQYIHDPRNPQSISNDEVMCILQDSSGKFWIGTFGGGLNIFDPLAEAFRRYEGTPGKPFDFRTILALYQDSKGYLWLTTSLEGVARIDPGTGDYTIYEYTQANSGVQIFEEVLAITEDHNGGMWFGTRNMGLYRLDPRSGEFTFYTHDPADPNSLGANAIYALHEDTKGNLWIGTRGAGLNVLELPAGEEAVFQKISSRQGLFGDWVLGIQEDGQGNIWASGSGLSEVTAGNRQVRSYFFSESNQGAFYKSPVSGKFYLGSSGFDIFHPDSIEGRRSDSRILINGFSRYNSKDQSGAAIDVPGIYTYDSITMRYTDKVLTLEYLSLDYDAQEERHYAYLLENFNKDWIRPGTERKITLIGLSPGKYRLRVKTISSTGSFSDNEATLALSILPPWWKSGVAYGAYVIAFILGLYGFIRLRTRSLKREKEVLEAVVEERTREISDQKDEIRTQRDQIQEQRDTVISQRDEIIESINYARQIQSAMLPPESYINELLHENFILYRPRDIVSGDFYWVKQIRQYIILAAADCTGHGIPGALLSMLGISYLNEIVQRREITQADQIMNELRDQIKRSLRQHGQPDESRDGIDMALCVIDLKNMAMQYAGAYNPLYMIREKAGKPALTEIKGDRMPLGYYQSREGSFANHCIKLERGDTFYLFSDGLVDQQGGREHKKFKSARFKRLLLEIQDLSMQMQKETLERTIKEWMDGHPQIDDILVVGVRV